MKLAIAALLSLVSDVSSIKLRIQEPTWVSEVMQMFDSSGDNVITEDEYRKVFQDWADEYDYELQDDDWTWIMEDFNNADENNGGSVTAEELEAYLSGAGANAFAQLKGLVQIRSKAQAGGLVDDYMAMFDTEGAPDDKISLDEYKNGITEIAAGSGYTLSARDLKKAEREFKRADADNSGFVERDELRAALGM